MFECTSLYISLLIECPRGVAEARSKEHVLGLLGVGERVAVAGELGLAEALGADLLATRKSEASKLPVATSGACFPFPFFLEGGCFLFPFLFFWFLPSGVLPLSFLGHWAEYFWICGLCARFKARYSLGWWLQQERSTMIHHPHTGVCVKIGGPQGLAFNLKMGHDQIPCGSRRSFICQPDGRFLSDHASQGAAVFIPKSTYF